MANLGNGIKINSINVEAVDIISPSGIVISALNFDMPAENLFEATFRISQIGQSLNYDFTPQWGASLWLTQD